MRPALLLGGLVVAALATSGVARADDLPDFAPPSTAPSPRGSVLFDVHAGLTALRGIPTLTLNDSALAKLRGGATRVAGAGPLTMATAGLDFGFALGRLTIPMLGADFGVAVLRSDRVVTAIDGSLAEVRPWTSRRLDVWIFGVGYRVKHRRWMFEATLQPGVAVDWTDAAVANGRDFTTLATHDLGIAVRLTLAACRRFDPTTRGCLYAAPSLYEFAPLNALTVGLSWEIGS